MQYNKQLHRLTGFLLVLCLLGTLLIGCAQENTGKTSPEEISPEENLSIQDDDFPQNGAEAFDIFINELYVDAVTSDSITLNYNLADPSAFGIKDIEPTLGEVINVEIALREREKSIAEAKRLHSFDYSLLRDDQKIIFDILTRSYELNYSEEFIEDQIYYLGYIKPLNGIQVQLPILLAEINFRTEADFDVYFGLLEDTPRYFNEIIEFERERAARGFSLSNANIDEVVDQIESYISNREDNFLIEVVNDIIDEYDGLSDTKKTLYKQRNSDLVLNQFLPAYENLAEAMRELRGVGPNNAGLASLPGGKEFAEVYLKNRTDSDMTPEEMLAALESILEQSQTRLWEIWGERQELMDKYFTGELGVIPYDTPENYLQMLETAIMNEYPPLGRINVNIREVHPSLQEFISPAFYLSPAVDDFYNNVIYTNPTKIDDNFNLFTALAHEGYPGHMYQFVFFRQQSPHPIRTLLAGIGYTEGWASYAEYDSFFFTDIDDEEAEVLKMVRIIDLVYMSIVDLNVNAFGWDIERLSEHLSSIGISDKTVVEDIFNRVAGVPLFYLPYTIGYIELVSLREHAEKKLGDNFSALNFNRYILEFGDAPFPVIRQHIDTWIASEKSN